MKKIAYVLKDEIVNIFAMTYGGVESKFSHQIFLCKKVGNKKDWNDAFLLDTKARKSNFKLSVLGENYEKSISSMKYEHRYIAFIDCFIEIAVKLEVFEKLCSSGFFDIWNSKSPFMYFGDRKTGYLAVFRVYEIDKEVHVEDRGVINTYYDLNNPIYCDAIEPVIDDDTFLNMKSELIQMLKVNNWLINVINSPDEFPPYMSADDNETNNANELLNESSKNSLESDDLLELDKLIESVGSQNSQYRWNIEKLNEPIQSDVKVKKDNDTFKGIHKDFNKVNMRRNIIGRLGEQLILKYEKDWLINNNCKHLADRVEYIAETKGDGEGYDILSFTLDGNEKYVEVKTSSQIESAPFFISQNEVLFSKKRTNQYSLYHVFSINKKTLEVKFYEYKGDVEKNFRLEPVQYRAVR